MSKIEGGQKVRKDIPRVVRLRTVVVTIELLFEPYLWTATAKIKMASKSNLFYAFYVVHNLLSIPYSLELYPLLELSPILEL